MMYTKPASPQPIGSVLDNGFSLYRHALAETFPFAFLAALATAPFGRLSAVSATGSTPNAGLLVVAGLVGMAVAILLYVPIIAKVYAVQHGSRLPAAKALELGVRRWLVMLGVVVLFGLAMVVGFALLVIPGFIALVYLAFAPVVAVVEPQGVIGSLKRGVELVRGQWWRTALLLTVIGVVVGVLSLLAGFVIQLLVGIDQAAILEGRPLPWYVDFLAGPVVSGVLSPLGYALLMAVYDDLKLRHEGADIAERIAASEA